MFPVVAHDVPPTEVHACVDLATERSEVLEVFTDLAQDPVLRRGLSTKIAMHDASIHRFADILGPRREDGVLIVSDDTSAPLERTPG